MYHVRCMKANDWLSMTKQENLTTSNTAGALVPNRTKRSNKRHLMLTLVHLFSIMIACSWQKYLISLASKAPMFFVAVCSKMIRLLSDFSLWVLFKNIKLPFQRISNMHLSLTFKILHMQRKTQHNSGKKSLWLPSTNPLWLNCLCELNWEFVISCKWALNRLLFANANIFKLQFLLLCTVHCLVDIRRLGRWGGVESLEQNSYRQGREGFCKFLGTL